MGTRLTVVIIRMGQNRAPTQTRNLKAFGCISGWYTVYRPIANLGMGIHIETFYQVVISLEIGTICVEEWNTT